MDLALVSQESSTGSLCHPYPVDHALCQHAGGSENRVKALVLQSFALLSLLSKHAYSPVHADAHPDLLGIGQHCW